MRVSTPWDDEHLGELLSGLLDGELESGEMARVSEHLEACSRCEVELDEIRSTRRALRLLPVVDPPAEFPGRLFDVADGPELPRAPESSDEADVVDMAAKRRRLRGVRVPVVNVAAAAAIVAVVATIASNAVADDLPTEVPLASQQHASAVAALVGSGSLRQDAAPFAMPDTESASTGDTDTATAGDAGTLPMPDADIAPTVDAERLPAPFQAPRTLAGGYTLVEAFDLPSGTHLVYRNADFGLSIFEEEGHIDEEALPPGGTRRVFGDDELWRWEGAVIAGRVVVTEHHGVVITAIGDEPGEAVLDAVRSFPGPRSLSNIERLRRFAGRALEGLNLAG